MNNVQGFRGALLLVGVLAPVLSVLGLIIPSPVTPSEPGCGDAADGCSTGVDTSPLAAAGDATPDSSFFSPSAPFSFAAASLSAFSRSFFSFCLFFFAFSFSALSPFTPLVLFAGAGEVDVVGASGEGAPERPGAAGVGAFSAAGGAGVAAFVGGPESPVVICGGNDACASFPAALGLVALRR